MYVCLHSVIMDAIY